MSVNLSVFAEDTHKQSSGVPIYPLSGEDMFFSVPRVGGFEYNKQIQAIIKSIYGIYHNHEDVCMSTVHAAWLGEYVTDFGGICDASDDSKDLEFSRTNCRAIFANKAYHNSLVGILINKASSFEYYLTEEGREAIEELKKR